MGGSNKKGAANVERSFLYEINRFFFHAQISYFSESAALSDRSRYKR